MNRNIVLSCKYVCKRDFTEIRSVEMGQNSITSFYPGKQIDRETKFSKIMYKYNYYLKI